MVRQPTIGWEALSSRAYEKSKGVLPSTPLVPKTRMHSTFEPRRIGPMAHEVPQRPIHSLRSSMRMIDAREQASLFFLGRIMHDFKRVRPDNFQEWVKNFNGSIYPYDFLASFKQVAK